MRYKTTICYHGYNLLTRRTRLGLVVETILTVVKHTSLLRLKIVIECIIAALLINYDMIKTKTLTRVVVFEDLLGKHFQHSQPPTHQQKRRKRCARL